MIREGVFKHLKPSHLAIWRFWWIDWRIWCTFWKQRQSNFGRLIYVESHKMIQSMTKHINMQAAWSFFFAKASSTRSSCRVMVVCLLKLQMRKKDRRGFAWDGVAFGLYCSEAKTQCCFLLNVRCSDCFKHLGPQPKGNLDGKGFGWFFPPLLLTKTSKAICWQLLDCSFFFEG